MNDTEIRLRCVELTAQLGVTGGEAITLAESIRVFVYGEPLERSKPRAVNDG